MEATAVSIGKAVLDGALGYAKSVVAEQIALQLGVERDVVFIGDELEMMQSFLMAVDEEHDKNKVLLTWVKQVREVAYNVEDNLMDFALYSDSKKRFWWCIPGILWKRRDIAKEVKELKAKVEDVSNRNLRYRLIKGSGSKSTTGEEQASVASASTFGINEARRVAKEREKLKANLHLLITSDEKDLRVITVWGTGGDLGKTSAIREAYSHQDIYKTFGCIAWVMPTNPFNPNEFFHNLLRQFYVYSHEITEKSIRGNAAGYDVLKELEKMEWSHIIDQVSAYVNERRYLIVIDGISTIVEWDWIKTYFPDKKNGSRIIVSTQHVEIATLCTEQPYQVTELKQLSSEHAIYLFHKAKAMPASDLTGPSSNPNVSTTNGKNSAISNGEMQKEEQIPKDIGGNNVCTSSSGKKFEHSQTIALVDDEPIGRKTDKSKVIDLISQTNGEEGCKVISV